ncbi:MAG TPA: Spy/CpxP family protein refolding chaperone [Candidatus Limnocylindrales bacterium]|nr:Spy/CpxP family protein refolding chaperone [Candidatus Limnocylindrales bacterium]
MEDLGHTEPNHPYPEKERSPRRGRRILGGLLLGGLAAGAVGFLAGSTMPVADAALHAFSRGPGCHGEKARERIGTFVSFAMHRLDATDEQEERVQSVVAEAIDELEPLRDQHRAHRDELAALLSQPTVDRDAIEKLRQQELALAEELTQTIADAIADTADILTPDQRVELVAQLERLRHDHHH